MKFSVFVLLLLLPTTLSWYLFDSSPTLFKNNNSHPIGSSLKHPNLETKSSMVDPLLVISSELVAHLFSSLSTLQLTLLGRVSRGWRVTIQNDSVLNRVIDLVNLDRPLSELETIEVVQRLALLSTHPKNEIHVSLDPFLERFLKTKTSGIRKFDDFTEATSNQYLNLLDAIFLGTRGSLHKLILEVDSDALGSQPNSARYGDIFVKGSWKLVSKITNLKELVFKIPFPISLESVGEDGKRFQITNKSFSDGYLTFSGQFGRMLIQEVTEFTGKGLTQVGFKTSSFIPRRNNLSAFLQDEGHLVELKEFLDYLKESKSTLKKLEVRSFHDVPLELIFDFAITCQALQSFHLDARDYDLQSPELLSFPKLAPPSTLKVLDLMLEDTRFDFESPSLLSWIGTSLEYFKLDLGSDESTLNFSAEVPVQFLTDLINSNQRLERLELQKVGFIVPLNSLDLYSVSLPKLRSLKLSSTYFIGYDLFGKSQLPVLEDLSMNLIIVPNANICSIEAIFERCCSTLMNLDVWDEHQERDEEDYDYGEDEDEDEVEGGVRDESDEEGRRRRNWFDHNQNYRKNKQFTEERSEDLIALPRLKKLRLEVSSDRLDSLIKRFRFSKLDGVGLFGISPFLLQHFLNIEVLQDPDLNNLSLKAIVEKDREIKWKPIQPGHFSKLKDLSLCETSMMPNFFLQAQPQHLVQLFVFPHGLQVSPSSGLYDLENINCVISIVRSNSSTLQEVELESKFKIDLKGKVEIFHPKIQFDKLTGLNLRSCPLPLVEFFYKSCSMSNLSRLQLEFNGKTDPDLEGNLTFLMSVSRTLTELFISNLKHSSEQERRLEDFDICFPRLKKIELNRFTLDLVEEFSRFNYPQMIAFSASRYIHDMEFQKEVIRNKVSSINDSLSSNAPKLRSKSIHCANNRCRCKYERD